MIIDTTQSSYTLTLQSGYQEVELKVSQPLTLYVEANVGANVFFKITKATDVTIEYKGHPNSDVTFLLWNIANSDIQFKENYAIYKDASLKLCYGDLGPGGFVRDIWVKLLEKGAHALVKSASLVKNKKHYYMNVVSACPYTYGEMENYSVVLEDGDYKMDATGKIEKGAYQSSSHQTSRALCLSDHQTSFIQPNLLIDENDVLASHATSVGRIDEGQMIYMQSRGLKTPDIMALISFGYLLPIVDMIENEEMRDQLRKSIESQVAKECMI